MYILFICLYFSITAISEYISSIIGLYYLTCTVSLIYSAVLLAVFSSNYSYNNKYILTKPKTICAIYSLFLTVGLLGNITQIVIFGACLTTPVNTAISVIIAAISETVIFQIIPFSKITEKQSAITIGTLSSVVFALFHLFSAGNADTASVILSITAFAFCLAAGFITYITNNPLFALFAHLAVNISGIFVKQTSVIACLFVAVIYLILAYIFISDSREKNNEVLH